MALIKCPECGVEISDKATVCPKCGNLTNVDSITVAEAKEEQQTNNFSPKKKKSLLKQAILMWPLLILEIILVLAPLVISSFADFTVPDKLPEYTIVAALVVNIILAARLSVKIWKELRVAVKEKKHIKKNMIALILSIGFLLFNCSYLYGGIFSKDSTIVGTWESDFLGGYSTRYVFDENGEFTSYVIENESGIKVPGGKGTYTVNNGEVVITMSGGSVINDEYEIDGDKLKLNGYTWRRVD